MDRNMEDKILKWVESNKLETIKTVLGNLENYYSCGVLSLVPLSIVPLWIIITEPNNADANKQNLQRAIAIIRQYIEANQIQQV